MPGCVYAKRIFSLDLFQICRSIKANQDKQAEEEFIDFIVKSVMPPSTAKELLRRNSDVEDRKANAQDNKSKTKLIFRPFTMDRHV